MQRWHTVTHTQWAERLHRVCEKNDTWRDMLPVAKEYTQRTHTYTWCSTNLKDSRAITHQWTLAQSILVLFKNGSSFLRALLLQILLSECVSVCLCLWMCKDNTFQEQNWFCFFFRTSVNHTSQLIGFHPATPKRQKEGGWIIILYL